MAHWDGSGPPEKGLGARVGLVDHRGAVAVVGSGQSVNQSISFAVLRLLMVSRILSTSATEGEERGVSTG